MEAIYLQSMTDFVLEFSKTNHNSDEFENTITDYAEFLKQPLKLGMFVPCDKNGNILKGKPLSPAPDSEWIRWENEEFEFYEAREQVLFKDSVFYETKPHFQTKRILIMLNNKPDFRIYNQFNYWDGRIEKQYFPNNENLTIEDLVNFKLELTDSAIKQIGLKN